MLRSENEHLNLQLLYLSEARNETKEFRRLKKEELQSSIQKNKERIHCLQEVEKVMDLLFSCVITKVNHPDPFSLEISDFVTKSQLFKHVRNKQRTIRKITSVSMQLNLDAKLQNICAALKEAKSWWKEPIFLDPEIEHLLVIAHIKNRISCSDLATLFYWRSAFTRLESYNKPHPLYKRVTLFDPKGRIRTLAVNLVFQTVNPKRYHSMGRYKMPFIQILNEDELFLWFNLMRHQRAFQQQFLITEICTRSFYYPSEKKTYDSTILGKYLDRIQRFVIEKNRRMHIMDAVYHNAKINIFNRVEYKNRYMQMIPSAGMVIALLQVKKAVVSPVFRFGMGSSLRENGLHAERDVSLQSNYAPPFVEADSYPAEHDLFTSHDLLFHLILLLYLPLSHQHLFIAYTDALKNSGEPVEKLQYLIDAIQDMEANVYVPSRLKILKENASSKENLQALAFWYTIADSINAAQEMTYLRSFRDHLAKNAHLPIEEQALKAKSIILSHTNEIDPSILRANQYALRQLFNQPFHLRESANVSSRDLIALSAALKKMYLFEHPTHELASYVQSWEKWKYLRF